MPALLVGTDAFAAPRNATLHPLHHSRGHTDVTANGVVPNTFQMALRTTGWRSTGLTLVAAMAIFITGCASVTHGTTQQVKVETLTAGGEIVNGAECRIANDKSAVMITSGQTTSIRRSGVNLSIECEQAGHLPASGQAISRINGGMVGNLLIGGLIGVAIDSGTGAGFDYPAWMQLVFGEVKNFDRGAQTDSTRPTAGIRLGLTQIATAASTATAAAAATATAEPSAAVAVMPPSPAPGPPVIAPAAPEPSRPFVQLSPPQADASSTASPLPPTQQPQSPAPTRPTARVSMDDLRALLPAKP